MAQRSRFRGPSPGRRRSVTWGGGPNAASLAISSTSKQVWTNGVVLALDSEATLVRIRGMVHVHLLTASAVGDGFIGAVGLGIVTSEAFAIGVTAIPSPLGENDWDGWMWHSFFDVRAITATIADGANAMAIDQHIELDSKAMRKFSSNQVLAGVVGVSESGAATMELNAQCRILLKIG